MNKKMPYEYSFGIFFAPLGHFVRKQLHLLAWYLALLKMTQTLAVMRMPFACHIPNAVNDISYRLINPAPSFYMLVSCFTSHQRILNCYLIIKNFAGKFIGSKFFWENILLCQINLKSIFAF